MPRTSRSSGPDALSQALGRSTPSRGTTGCLLFLSVFLILFGAGIGWVVFARPALQILASRSWPVLSCRVLSSQVRRDRGSGSTYRADIHYLYTVGGHEYESNRYDFLGGSDSNLGGKEAIVARYPVGSRAICFVDPAHPDRAVLSRGWSAVYLVGLLPLAMLVFGVLGFVKVISGGQPGATPSPGWLPTPQNAGEGFAAFGPLVLKPRETPLGKFFGMLFVAAFWNGITGVFVWHLVATFREGNPEWGLALFLSIFVLIGLALLLAVPYTFLALWNPRPHLTLGRGLLRLGDTVGLEWRFTGLPGRIQRLRITLEGREEATYITRTSRSSSTSTAREVFHTVEFLDTTDPIQIPAGSVRLAIPADTMHSFAASSNRIVWSLQVKGEIRRWPDVDEPFEVAVQPRLASTAGGASAAGGSS